MQWRRLVLIGCAHLPKGQILGKDGIRSVDALGMDELLQPRYVRAGRDSDGKGCSIAFHEAPEFIFGTDSRRIACGRQDHVQVGVGVGVRLFDALHGHTTHRPPAKRADPKRVLDSSTSDAMISVRRTTLLRSLTSTLSVPKCPGLLHLQPKGRSSSFPLWALSCLVLRIVQAVRADYWSAASHLPVRVSAGLTRLTLRVSLRSS